MFKLLKKYININNNINETEPVTVISKGMKIAADLLSGDGIVRIEGEYHGEIYMDGELFVEKSGYVNGNINVRIAYISGSVTGNIKCSDLLHVTSTGKINGDIECEAILMDEGAVFIGYSRMSEKMNGKMNEKNPDPLGFGE